MLVTTDGVVEIVGRDRYIAVDVAHALQQAFDDAAVPSAEFALGPASRRVRLRAGVAAAALVVSVLRAVLGSDR